MFRVSGCRVQRLEGSLDAHDLRRGLVRKQFSTAMMRLQSLRCPRHDHADVTKVRCGKGGQGWGLGFRVLGFRV